METSYVAKLKTLKNDLTTKSKFFATNYKILCQLGQPKKTVIDSRFSLSSIACKSRLSRLCHYYFSVFDYRGGGAISQRARGRIKSGTEDFAVFGQNVAARASMV